jgi:hypothetical protein
MISQKIKPRRLLTDHYLCPDGFVDLDVTEELSGKPGYFRFGPGVICYGQCSSGVPVPVVTDSLHDALNHVSTCGRSVCLPFDPIQVVNNIRHERYLWNPSVGKIANVANSLKRRLYYLARPLMSVAVRKHLQRQYFRGWNDIVFPRWPVDLTIENIFEQLLILSMKSRHVERIPFIWFWPDAALSCCIVTHDVETKAGRDFCTQLMDLDDSFGIKSAIQIVPEERYTVPQTLLDCIRERGFELNVHDLNHDGNLMANRGEFLRRAIEINHHAKKFGALGFRSAVLYRNIDWYDALEFSYDMSVPNVAHLDPQRGGCCTVFPFFNGKILELPVTMAQDYTLFHILKDYSIGVWMEQISLIRKKHGLMQMIVHPDYIIDKSARRVYAELLWYLSELRAQGETWIALPCEVAAWWRLRSGLSLVKEGTSWHIQGDGKDKARIAYATIVDGKLTYEFEPFVENVPCHAS